MHYGLSRDGVVTEVRAFQSFTDANGVARGPSWLTSASSDDIATAGLLPIQEVAVQPSVFQDVRGYTLVLDGDHYNRVPTVVDLDLATAQARVGSIVDSMVQQGFDAGYTPTTGTLAGKILQVRNDTDKTNWLTSQAAYKAQIDAGQGATVGATFRTADNLNFVLSFLEGYQTLLGMAAWGASLKGAGWNLKDAANSASDLASLKIVAAKAGIA